ncbi:sporulation protein [Micromonospora zhanjiangensis]|uniref:Sporulation protein n=1 Tax=Micromonospora zhanjiangensis TaxID=1522057 RepID=A0ABV8KGL2_9ACTN
MFGGPAAGLPGLSVQTDLPNPSTRPGLRLPGRVTVTANLGEVRIDGVRVGLVAKVEGADGGQSLVEFHRVPVAGPFLLAAGERRVIPFAAPLPWQTPVTVLAGVVPLALRLALRTEVLVDAAVERDDLRPVIVHPLPAQDGILTTLDGLGFQLRAAALRAGRLPGVRQEFSFHQMIGYWVAPLYAGPISELELTFLADPTGLDVICWADRRLAMSGGGHLSLSRFRVAHAGADRLDWQHVVDGWLRHAVERHAWAASRYHTWQHFPESVHASRPPQHTRDGVDPGFTAGSGGSGGASGGGGDGT